MSNVLLEDIVEIKDIDADGKKFKKVSRINGLTDLTEIEFVLDINCEIYEVKPGDHLSFCITSTLDLHGEDKRDQTIYDPDLFTGAKKSLLDQYEYAMFGKVFKFKTIGNDKLAIYFSFGGLLLRLTGNPSDLSRIGENQSVYILIKKALK